MTDPSTTLADAREAQHRMKTARRLACRLDGHRWWPLSEPWQVSDGPALGLCLHCGDVKAMQVYMPSAR